MVSSKTVVISALSYYIVRNSADATQIYAKLPKLLPWQTNITFIIRFFLSDLLCIAVFCAVYRGIFFLLPIWQNGAKTTKRGKFLQTADIISSKIVVEIWVFYY